MASNHEDAIASLMNEMSQQQGYSAPSEKRMNATKKSKTCSRRILLAELDGYPNNSKCTGSHSIWNPYVAQEELPKNDYSGNNVNLPTSPQVEILRRRAYEKFKQECFEGVQQSCSTWKLKQLPIPSMLEKWQMDSKLQESELFDIKDTRNSQRTKSYPRIAPAVDIHRLVQQQQNSSSYYDPILLGKQASSLFLPSFQQEVQKAWKKISPHPSPPKFGKKSTHVQKNLHRLICQALESFEHQLQQAANQMAIRSTNTRKLPKIRHVDDDQVEVTYSGVTFKVHSAYFIKLQRLFDRATRRNDDTISFEEAVFCLLCRYDMLQGAGLQAGVPGKIMDVLLDRLDCRMECFASPLNCRYQNYASAFDDVDGCFGSLGSFFHLDFSEGGCYEANPPFCEGLIARMNTTIQKALANTSDPLMFVVFVPAWKESSAYQQLLAETHDFLTKHLLLEQGKHWYAEGTQHRRKGSFRVASFDTSIIFYQNDAAKSKWTIDELLLEELTNAFCQDPGVMEKSSAVDKTKQIQTEITERGKETKSKLEIPSHLLPSSPKKSLLKGVKRLKADKKRKWTKNHKNENEAQLDLLESLGLSSTSDEPKKEGNKPKDFHKKSTKKKMKKRR